MSADGSSFVPSRNQDRTLDRLNRDARNDSTRCVNSNFAVNPPFDRHATRPVSSATAVSSNHRLQPKKETTCEHPSQPPHQTIPRVISIMLSLASTIRARVNKKLTQRRDQRSIVTSFKIADIRTRQLPLDSNKHPATASSRRENSRPDRLPRRENSLPQVTGSAGLQVQHHDRRVDAPVGEAIGTASGFVQITSTPPTELRRDNWADNITSRSAGCSSVKSIRAATVRGHATNHPRQTRVAGPDSGLSVTGSRADHADGLSLRNTDQHPDRRGGPTRPNACFCFQPGSEEKRLIDADVSTIQYTWRMR